jgi:TonB family protein
MGFTIDGKGRVSQAQVRSSTLQDPAVEQCLLARVRTWKFPAPSDGGECAIEYPFVFAPSH